MEALSTLSLKITSRGSLILTSTFTNNPLCITTSTLIHPPPPLILPPPPLPYQKTITCQVTKSMLYVRQFRHMTPPLIERLSPRSFMTEFNYPPMSDEHPGANDLEGVIKMSWGASWRISGCWGRKFYLPLCRITESSFLKGFDWDVLLLLVCDIEF